MTDRYDICAPRPGKDKTFWLKIGTMFPAREGEGFSIKLDALPLPNEKGEIWIKAFAPRQPDAQEPRQDRRAPAQGSRPVAPRDALDDDIPFAPEVRG